MQVHYICRSGGIGRRKGLKIPRRQRRAGSSPAFGTQYAMDEEHFITKLEKRKKKKSLTRRLKRRLNRFVNTKTFIFICLAVVLGYIVGKWLLDYLLSLE